MPRAGRAQSCGVWDRRVIHEVTLWGSGCSPPPNAAADAAARAGPAGRMTAFYMLSLESPPQPVARRMARAALGIVVALLLAVAMTWPLAAGFGTYGRTRGVDADGMYAIWNVSWVAHALTSDPRQLFDANIFHPHRWALAFSELNIVAGIVGIPGWLLTRDRKSTRLNSSHLVSSYAV